MCPGRSCGGHKLQQNSPSEPQKQEEGAWIENSPSEPQRQEEGARIEQRESSGPSYSKYIICPFFFSYLYFVWDNLIKTG